MIICGTLRSHNSKWPTPILWGQVHKVKYKYKYEVLKNIKYKYKYVNFKIFKYKYKYTCSNTNTNTNTFFQRLVFAGVYDIPPIA